MEKIKKILEKYEKYLYFWRLTPHLEGVIIYTTVSYTHLDVYKRQVRIFSASDRIIFLLTHFPNRLLYTCLLYTSIGIKKAKA